ncbi:MAG: hypothetical protein WBF33_38080 [Candidatus Nitrosopolaris sp.]
MGRGVLGFVRILASLLVQLAWWMEQLLHVVDNKATDMSHHALNHINIASPLLGVAGFIPGLIFELTCC